MILRKLTERGIGSGDDRDNLGECGEGHPWSAIGFRYRYSPKARPGEAIELLGGQPALAVPFGRLNRELGGEFARNRERFFIRGDAMGVRGAVEARRLVRVGDRRRNILVHCGPVWFYLGEAQRAVTAMAVDERFGAGAELNRPDGANNDSVAMSLDDLLDSTVDHSERLLEAERARSELAPTRAFIALDALDAAASGEAIRDSLMARVENVDAIMALALDDWPSRSVAIDADQHGRRIQGERYRRLDGKSRPRLVGAGGDYADSADEMAHRLPERRCSGNMRWDVSHSHRHPSALLCTSRLAESTTTPSQKA